MGRIVTGGRSQSVVLHNRDFSKRLPAHKNTTALHLRFPKGYEPAMYTVERGGKAGVQVIEDMALVREHYGLNISDALRIALHLTANAIRANKAHVEVA